VLIVNLEEIMYNRIMYKEFLKSVNSWTYCKKCDVFYNSVYYVASRVVNNNCS